MANGLNTIIIKRDISSSSNNNNNSNFQKDNKNFIKIEQSLKVNNNNNTMIKREIIDSNNLRIINNNTLLKSQQNLSNNNNKSITASSSSVVVSPSGGSATNNNNNNSNTLTCGNTKMGSRRIFTPQFKLQVLESYRNDNDCKGNQRATARKYGIHRRQIQKWLQCESNLRTSVANQNNNNNNNVIIKHQFHNISHNNHSQQQQSILTNLNSSNNNHQQYNKISSSSTNNAAANNIQMSLDSARHSVALNSIQILSPPLSTSSSSTTVAAIPSMAATTTQSSMAGVAITTSSSSPISIRSPIQINCNNVGKSLLQHHHHQQQNTMPYLTNTPAINTSVSVPIPIIPTHSSTATAAAAAAYYHQYHLQLQHHNDIVTSHNQHNHHQQQHHQQQQQQTENCMPSSVSLPIPTAATAIHQYNNYHNATINTTSAPLIATAITNQTNELNDYQPIYTATTGNQITLSSNYEEFAISRQPSQQEQPKIKYENLYNDNHDYYQMEPIHHQTNPQQYEYIDITTVTSSPIDLSLSHKKDRNTCNDAILDRRNLNYDDDKKIIKFRDYTKLIISKQEIETNNNNNYNEKNNIKNNDDSLIVDLSCRKRKKYNVKYEMPQEKVQKICENVTSSNNNNNDQSEENDQKQHQQQPKPVKLFKPYLLDDNNVDENQLLKKSDQQDPIIWSHHPSSNYDSQCSSRGSNFHGGSPIEYPFPVGSPTISNQNYQQSHIITSTAIQSPCASSSADSCCNRSIIVQSPISSVPPISPRSPGTTATQTNSTFWCPKGSPVSGYDTASTYSDCSDYYKTTATKDITGGNYLGEQQQQQRIVKQSSSAVTYTIDLKMHTVDNYYTNHYSQSGNLIRSRSDTEQFISQNGLYRNHHVQRWLDHDSAADVRQGIAVYV